MKYQQLVERPFTSLPELLDLNALQHPDKRALVQGDDALTYLELQSASKRVAATLQRDGVVQFNSVAIVSANTLSACVIFLGALRAGCVVTPIASSSMPAQIASMIADSGAKIVFVDSDVEPGLVHLPVHIVNLEALDDWLTSMGAEPSPVSIEPQDVFNIIYSSGTTGTPKGIIHTHAMRWAQIAALDAQLDAAVMMVATPLYSNTTLVSFLPTLAFGGTVVLLRKFDARQFLQIAEQERATHTMLVPAQYQRIMAIADFDQFNLDSFRFKLCTSAPFSTELKGDVLRRWPGLLIEIYGMSEGGGTCMLIANEFPHKLHSVGRPAPNNDVRLIDEHGNEVAQGEVGEVVGRSGNMMVGYHGRPDATRDVYWTDAQGNRFIRHGDLGRFDEDGFLTLLGRTKDMIISGGFNVYPPDIEAVMLQHPGVLSCAVIGVPSVVWGETPYAFYVPADDALKTAELVSWVNERVGKTQRLSGAQSIEELPISPVGKVLKRALRDLFQAG